MLDPKQLLEHIADMESKGYEEKTILKSIKSSLTAEKLNNGISVGKTDKDFYGNKK